MRRRLVLGLVCAGIVLVAPQGATAQYVAPDPGGDETADVAIPPPGGKFYGLNDDFIDYAHHQSPESYAGYASMVGSNTTKMSLEWWRAERRVADEWVPRRWEVWAEAYNAVRAEGMTPLFILSSAPCWARVDPCTPGDAAELQRYPPTPANEAEWAEFVGTVATCFPNSIIQVWNEVNLTFWWRGSATPEPARYTRLLKLGYDAVQQVEGGTPATGLPAACPGVGDIGVDTPVVGPALANLQAECGDGGDNDFDGQTDFPNDPQCSSVTDDSEGAVPLDGHMPMAQFLEEAYAAPISLADPIKDALALNIFAHSNQYGANTLFAESFQQARTAKTAASDTDPIYITETGLGASFFPTNKEANRGFALLRLYRRLMTMSDVGMVVFHRIIEPKDINFNPLETDYAWLKYQPAPPDQDTQTQAAGLPEPKYVYCLFSQLAYLSSGATPAERDPERFYPPCGAVISQSDANPDTTWTFAFGTPNYPSYDHLECSVDGAAFATCTSPFTTGPLPGPGHTFAVRAVDPGGQFTPAAVQSFPDNVAPTATFDSGPAPGSTTGDSTPTFEFSANQPAVFECELDGAAAVPCTSPWTLKPEDALSDAVHTLKVVAIDDAGNRSLPIQRSFRVEAALPVVQVDSPAEGAAVADTTPTVTFSASEDATFQCRFDGNAPVACNSGSFTAAVPLGQGSHTFTVVATDTAGNVSAPAQRTFTVDTVPPSVSITFGPANGSTISDSTPTFRFNSEPGATFQCARDVPVFGACNGPPGFHTTASLGDGPHTFAVKATDAAGNSSPAANRSFTVEQPNTKVTSAKISGRKRKATFGFQATAGAAPLTFECKLDKKDFTSCESPRKYRRLKPGRHKFQVRAVSFDGVADATPAKERFKIPRRR